MSTWQKIKASKRAYTILKTCTNLYIVMFRRKDNIIQSINAAEEKIFNAHRKKNDGKAKKHAKLFLLEVTPPPFL